MKTHTAIIIKDNNKILFIKRSMKKKTLPGAYSFPSGTIEEGETPFETTIREGNEELGVTLEPEKIISEKELPELDVKLIFILCRIECGVPRIMDFNEIEKIEWITFQDFFDRFSDNEIGHGLIWLRKNPNIWKDI